MIINEIQIDPADPNSDWRWEIFFEEDNSSDQELLKILESRSEATGKPVEVLLKEFIMFSVEKDLENV